MKTATLLLLACSFFAAANGQTTSCSITGFIRNAKGQQVEAATVLLQRVKDSAVVRSAVTDKQGRFILERVAAGRYILAVTSIGYDRSSGNLVTVDGSAGKLQTPDIVLQQAVRNLQAAVVTQHSFVEWKLDKLIVHVGSSPFFTPGMTTLEMLERSPGIEVDYLNNTIGLIGRAGTNIYINGRLSYLGGADLLNYLRGLPAGSIEQIEIMAQPSAKYDASSTGGAINIVLKRNQADGIYGSATASAIAGDYFKTRDNFLLNWRRDKTNLNFTAGVSDYKTYSDQSVTSSFRPAYGAPFDHYQQYQTRTVSVARSFTPELSLDYQFSKKSSVGLVLSGLLSSNSASTNGTVALLDSLKRPEQQAPVPTMTRGPVRNLGIDGNWQYNWSNDRQLTIDADYLYYRSPGVQDSYLLNGAVPSDIDIYAAKADYSQPLKLGKDCKFEAGIKSSYVRTNNASNYERFDQVTNRWVADTALNNHFVYAEQIHAGYVNLSRQINKKWSAELGLRGEETISQGNETVQGGRFRHSYFSLFPTAFLGFAPNDRHTFDLSYGRNIARPSYLDLNPFRYVINAYNVREGNPGLAPSFSHTVIADYHYRSVLSISLIYYKGNDVFGRVLMSGGQGANQITILTKENIAWRRNYFLSFFYSVAIAKWWNASWGLTIIDAKLHDPTNAGAIDDELIGAKLYLTNQFPAGRGWSFEVRSNSATRWMEGIRIHQLPVENFSVGVNKKMWNNKGTLTVNLNDPLRLYKPGQTTDAMTFYSRTDIRPESRLLTVTLNWQFGRAKRQQRRTVTESAADEEHRVDF